MSGSFLGYGLLAVLIAVVLSSVELLTKHQSRSLGEIFGSIFYFYFALLNAVFCFLVYWALPGLSGTVLEANLPIDIKSGLGRAVAAGLGYLVIARLSILDVTTKAGETYGAGFDAIYNAFAQYFLRHHSGRIRKTIRDDFFKVYSDLEHTPEAFVDAAKLLSTQLEAAEKAQYEERLKLALASPEDRVAERSLSLYQLIRDHTTSQQETEQLLRQQLSPRA